MDRHTACDRVGNGLVPIPPGIKRFAAPGPLTPRNLLQEYRIPPTNANTMYQVVIPRTSYSSSGTSTSCGGESRFRISLVARSGPDAPVPFDTDVEESEGDDEHQEEFYGSIAA